MTKEGIKFLKLMFREGETICISPNQFGYHSIPLEKAWDESVTLVPTLESVERRNEILVKKGLEPLPFESYIEKCPSQHLTLVALNPIQGYRGDSQCYKYRNFLLELDTGSIKDQVEYIRKLKIPFSAMVFSGSKSVHTLISLDEDLPSEKVYRHLSEWLLRIATMADNKTKNPSRSIRVPGGLRDENPEKIQRLMYFNGPVKLSDLTEFLKGYEHLRPQPKQKRRASEKRDLSILNPKVVKQLQDGIDFTNGRNNAWFVLACYFCEAGFSEEETIECLTPYFKEERSFKEKEWLISINSAFKHILEQR